MISSTLHEGGRQDVALFDLDGTLTDPYVGIVRSYRHALEALGIAIAPEHDFRAAIGPPLQGVIAMLVGDDPTLQARAIALTGLDPARAVMIGDRSHDIVAALANGVAPVGVSWGYGSESELRAAGARTIFDRPETIDRGTLDAAILTARTPESRNSGDDSAIA